MLTKRQANHAVREGIRRATYLSSLTKDSYERLTIADIRALLADALDFEIPSESQRLLHLSVSIRRQCRLKGWIVQVPANAFYTKAENQTKKAPLIADRILAKEMHPAD